MVLQGFFREERTTTVPLRKTPARGRYVVFWPISRHVQRCLQTSRYPFCSNTLPSIVNQVYCQNITFKYHCHTSVFKQVIGAI